MDEDAAGQHEILIKLTFPTGWVEEVNKEIGRLADEGLFY